MNYYKPLKINMLQDIYLEIVSRETILEHNPSSL